MNKSNNYLTSNRPKQNILKIIYIYIYWYNRLDDSPELVI